MAERIGATPVRYPFSFVIAGDSGAWPDPTADAIFAQLLTQTAELRPAPVFFANLGDFAGPGTRARHEHYLELVAPLPVPNVCLIGNHDLEDPRGSRGLGRRARTAELPLRLRHHALRRHRRRVGTGRRARRHDAGGHRRTRRRGAGLPGRHARGGLRAAPRGAAPCPTAPGRPLRAAARVRLPPGRAGVPGHTPPPSGRAGLLRPRPRLRPSRPRRRPLRHVGRRGRRAVPELPQRAPAPTGARSSTPSRSRSPRRAPSAAACCRRSRRATARRRSRSATSGRSMGNGAGDRPAVRVNQLGYLPAGPKRAVWVSDAREPAPFSVRDRRGADGVGRAHAAVAGAPRADLRAWPCTCSISRSCAPRERASRSSWTARAAARSRSPASSTAGSSATRWGSSTCSAPASRSTWPGRRATGARRAIPGTRASRRGPAPTPSGSTPAGLAQAASMSPAAGTTRAITASTSPAGRCPCGSCSPRSS